jgi:hypothetical protein
MKFFRLREMPLYRLTDLLVELRGYTNNFPYPANIIWPGTYAVTVYGIPCIGSRKPVLVLLRRLAPSILGLALVCALFTPVLASLTADGNPVPASKDTLAQDNPELIGPLKTHVAYVGQTQDARMDGVIDYIDTISDGTGSGSLREIQEDYMAVASSIPVMQTADDITDARTKLQRQSRLFAEETKHQIVTFNGSTDAMRAKTSASMQVVEDSITNLKESLWLAKDTARLTVFNQESEQRTAVLRSLTKKGIDVSQARNISEQIDARRTDIQKALSSKSVSALKAANQGLKLLNREFRTTVEESQTNYQIEMKRAAILAMK